MKKVEHGLNRMINNPCGHTGFESSVCEVCGYPDPRKAIARLKDEVERLNKHIEADPYHEMIRSLRTENAALKAEYKEMYDSVVDKDRVFCETLMQNKALKAEVERRKEQIMEYNESPDPDHYKRQTLHLREENVALEMKLIEFEKEKAWLRKKLGRASEHITELVVHCIRARDIMKEGTDTWRPWI